MNLPPSLTNRNLANAPRQRTESAAAAYERTNCFEPVRSAEEYLGGELANGALPFNAKALSNPEPSYWTRTTSILMRPITCMRGRKSANAAGEVRLLRASVM